MLAFHCAGPFLSPGVAAYIREHGLYDVNAQWKNLPMAKLEQVVIRLLNPNRVAHVLGCRDTAVALAKRWGADVTDAARAGILHDITKALDGPLQLTVCAEYGKILGEFSRKYPRTLHALTGSMVAERIFGENEAVVSAIRSHTTGKADMNLLETIIYVADYMEPNRELSRRGKASGAGVFRPPCGAEAGAGNDAGTSEGAGERGFAGVQRSSGLAKPVRKQKPCRKEEVMLTPKEIAYEVTKALDAKKGQNIKLLKIDRVSSLADYFLICTGTSGTHVKTLCDYAEYTLEQLGEQMLSREGHRGNSWELLGLRQHCRPRFY